MFVVAILARKIMSFNQIFLIILTLEFEMYTKQLYTYYQNKEKLFVTYIFLIHPMLCSIHYI